VVTGARSVGAPVRRRSGASAEGDRPGS